MIWSFEVVFFVQYLKKKKKTFVLPFFMIVYFVE